MPNISRHPVKLVRYYVIRPFLLITDWVPGDVGHLFRKFNPPQGPRFSLWRRRSCSCTCRACPPTAGGCSKWCFVSCRYQLCQAGTWSVTSEGQSQSQVSSVSSGKEESSECQETKSQSSHHRTYTYIYLYLHYHLAVQISAEGFYSNILVPDVFSCSISFV